MPDTAAEYAETDVRGPAPEPRDTPYWARRVSKLHVADVPTGAVNLNVAGRQVTGPLHGFGRMWQRTYRVRLPGVMAMPAEIMADWKANFARFQPPENHFYPPMTGVQPGTIMFINTELLHQPGLRALTPMSSGVLILYADDELFTVMTPEGFPISGWNTFSVYDEAGCRVAQIQGLLRTTDPIYEFGFRFFGGERNEDRVWSHVLTQLATYWGVTAEVEMNKLCMDPRLQWAYARNIWYNAMVRTLQYRATAPVRWIRKRLRH